MNRGVWIRDLVFPERLDPDPVDIRPDPQPCLCLLTLASCSLFTWLWINFMIKCYMFQAKWSYPFFLACFMLCKNSKQHTLYFHIWDDPRWTFDQKLVRLTHACFTKHYVYNFNRANITRHLNEMKLFQMYWRNWRICLYINYI